MLIQHPDPTVAHVLAPCAEWQAERARWFLEAANNPAYWVAAAMWELAYQYDQQGFGHDYITAWSNTTSEFYEIYNVNVR